MCGWKRKPRVRARNKRSARETRSSGMKKTDELVGVNQSSVSTGGSPSLEGIHGTVAIPHPSAGFWQQWRAFVGPAILVSVGYMDPGNWGTDLQSGAQFKYGLLWVVGLASIMAIIMQVISARHRHGQGPGAGM